MPVDDDASVPLARLGAGSSAGAWRALSAAAAGGASSSASAVVAGGSGASGVSFGAAAARQLLELAGSSSTAGAMPVDENAGVPHALLSLGSGSVASGSMAGDIRLFLPIPTGMGGAAVVPGISLRRRRGFRELCIDNESAAGAAHSADGGSSRTQDVVAPAAHTRGGSTGAGSRGGVSSTGAPPRGPPPLPRPRSRSRSHSRSAAARDGGASDASGVSDGALAIDASVVSGGAEAPASASAAAASAPSAALPSQPSAPGLPLTADAIEFLRAAGMTVDAFDALLSPLGDIKHNNAAAAFVADLPLASTYFNREYTDVDAKNLLDALRSRARSYMRIDQHLISVLCGEYSEAGWCTHGIRYNAQGRVEALRAVLVSPLMRELARSHPLAFHTLVLDSTFGTCVFTLDFFAFMFIEPTTQLAVPLGIFLRQPRSADAGADATSKAQDIAWAQEQLRKLHELDPRDVSGPTLQFQDRDVASMNSVAQTLASIWQRFSAAPAPPAPPLRDAPVGPVVPPAAAALPPRHAAAPSATAVATASRRAR